MQGINILNPVDIEKGFYEKAIEYAKEKGIDFIQINGPIHDPVKGNIDGMTPYKKYCDFNSEKDEEYVKYNLKVVNECLEKSYKYGIKSYMWHHELELPKGFEEAYPETLNKDGDVEVSHPRIKDFLENKIADFFEAYPKMDGIVLTLHETRIPLLKLKNQKLGKVERVKYVTKLIFDKCKALGKELIVRPFASVEEDYEMMSQAYSEISSELVVMDKWTQFDWSLCLPHNKFFAKIKNPLMIEADIFGEYFGKGKLPIYLKNHIQEKYAYCEKFTPIGYCSRIDRAGVSAFDTINEVNYEIMEAVTSCRNVEESVNSFFKAKYGESAFDLKELMRETEEIQKKIFYINGYYFTELSRFPTVNHSKNHFYFEIMRENYSVKSNEWFIPLSWRRGSIENLKAEKREAVVKSETLYKKLADIKGKISEKDFIDIKNKFTNLYYVAKIWEELLNVYIYYVKALEENGEYEKDLNQSLNNLIEFKKEAVKELGKEFYCLTADTGLGNSAEKDAVSEFVADVKKNFETEKQERKDLNSNEFTDEIICGSALEGHNLRKEVNFSDTGIDEFGIYRIAGTNRGKAWSKVNAHGWFSYDVKAKAGKENEIEITAKGENGCLDIDVEIDGVKTRIQKQAKDKTTVKLKTEANSDTINVRIDRITSNTPYIYGIKVR